MRCASHNLTRPPSRSLRFWVVLLALLQIIAPIWHVCALAGHASSPSAAHHGASQLKTNADGTRRALICWCAPPAPKGPKWSPVASHEHNSCLALLLQTLPGALALAPAFGFSSTKVEPHFPVRFERAPVLAILNRFRGRAPPAFA